ncbi:HalX domain-containing protein [Halomicroarcula sp. F27]|uniref:HalX domain-containing protein n=2 Tax=Haloarcula nitratireducens TaxID=2487749 RepID=A0AAW4PA95_9EURY|nr:HalX domain-containing protein [Halomicroarcula nitratireducens]MBX0294825.1 HalX domain-containing protein [Halomicroarcula nitratireducens]
MTADSETATVLVVDDERDVAELYATWLGMRHDVRSANSGESALEAVDESVDVVFLDRQMPGMSGDDVLDGIRERDLDCRVVMVTAVDPGFDIVEMPFDDYLTKPVTRADLYETVEEMLARDAYDEQIRQYFAMASKKATLEAEKNAAELDAHDEYHEVTRRVESLKQAADQTIGEIQDFEAAFGEFSGS